MEKNENVRDVDEITYGELSIRTIMLPKDTNPLGTIFGGVILSYVDLAGEIQARREAHQQYVTVALDRVDFQSPIFVGDVVSFYTKTTKVGRTSILIRVTVVAHRRDNPHQHVLVLEADITYIAIDENRRPTPIFP